MMQKVKCIQDEACNWYVIPNELSDKFHELQELAYNEGNHEAEDEFIATFDQYSTGGCLNNIQLYVEI